MGDLEFEGKFSNGKRWEVKLLNRKKDGKGKEYKDNSNIEFESEFLNGIRNLECNYHNDKLEFEGEYLDG